MEIAPKLCLFMPVLCMSNFYAVSTDVFPCMRYEIICFTYPESPCIQGDEDLMLSCT